MRLAVHWKACCRPLWPCYSSEGEWTKATQLILFVEDKGINETSPDQHVTAGPHMTSLANITLSDFATQCAPMPHDACNTTQDNTAFQHKIKHPPTPTQVHLKATRLHHNATINTARLETQYITEHLSQTQYSLNPSTSQYNTASNTTELQHSISRNTRPNTYTQHLHRTEHTRNIAS